MKLFAHVRADGSNGEHRGEGEKGVWVREKDGETERAKKGVKMFGIQQLIRLLVSVL